MGRVTTAILAFNRGLISRLGLARTDLKRYAFSAAQMVNWMCRTLGSMMLRPGWQYIGNAFSGSEETRFLPFIFSTDDVALVEIAPTGARFWVDEAPIIRPLVSATITNGSFTTNLAGWTASSANVSWVAPGYAQFVSDGTVEETLYQTVAIGTFSGTEHALRIVIERGPVTLRVGSTVGDDDYIAETSLGTGRHSLAFTPTTNFTVQFQSHLERIVLLNSCTIETSFLPVVLTDTALGLGDIASINYDQSGDVIFLAINGYQQRRIERRATRSWSIVLYEALDGPFMVENTGPITMAPSVLTGNGTLTASDEYFTSENVGSLFRVTSVGQRVTRSITGNTQFTNEIRVTGVGESRRFAITLSGFGTATLTLQRSIGVSGNWEAVQTYSADVADTYADGLDNQIVYYRIGTTAYTGGTIVATLTYTLGFITGVGRVTSFTSALVVNIEVLTAFGGTDASDVWAEGLWSDRRGWPSAVALYEGRLWWAGRNAILGSISDAYDGFDPDFEGDAGPINRTIGSGPVDDINWIMPMQRLILGAEGAEWSVRSTTFDEPLTPSNFNIKAASTQGSSSVAAVKVDSRGVFVQRSNIRVYELAYNVEINDYAANDLTTFVPEIGEPGIVRIAIQRQPDTRIHALRSDGTAAVGVVDAVENVRAWFEIETDGSIVDVVVLPGDIEDTVYYLVQRVIGGTQYQYLEKWALESDCVGGALNKQADSFVVYDGAPTTSISGLDHLEGDEVIVWGDGVDLSPDDASGVQRTYTVTGGAITLDAAVSQAVVGLPYEAPWQSSKLAYTDDGGTALSEKKKITRFGLILADAHQKGIRFGPDLTRRMDSLPDIQRGALWPPNDIHTEYDCDLMAFPGGWDTDSRLCLRARAPRPVTVLAAIIGMESHGQG